VGKKRNWKRVVAQENSVPQVKGNKRERVFREMGKNTPSGCSNEKMGKNLKEKGIKIRVS